ncbi:MAG: DUF4388 domain-containing protein [Caldilineae bacterium]|nr:MAG: DUF4388 domain-containing protein [Caldilineae bacterium]
MALEGNLQDMNVADLIQHNCQERRTARLDIRHRNQQATLFFEGGNVKHATLGDLQGEEVIYRILNWQDGTFSLEVGPETPHRSITRRWSGLLLEGAKRLDEANRGTTPPTANGTPSTSQKTRTEQEEKPMAKKKSELLADALAELLQESSDIDGAAVVGVDGLVYSANVPQRALDENLVGASSAAILGLSRRAVEQLKRGGFRQTLIQGDDGNIIVAALTPETLFVGLTSNNVNLGMAFAETRTMLERLREIL